MIIDKIENWELYHFGSVWRRAFEFLISLTPDSDEIKYNIQDDDIFAQVTSYKTRSPDEAVFETHRKYVDIQAVLIGGERIEWLCRDGLEIELRYDESKDVEFYKPVFPGSAHVDVFPGTFVMLFPQDAHMPALMLGKKAELVKKVVIKVKCDLLTTKVS